MSDNIIKKQDEQSKIQFTKLECSRDIPLSSDVRVTQMNHIVEILHMSKEPTGLFKIKKLDKFRYQNLETGEIFEYHINENRGQNLDSLRKTFKRLRQLINNNFTGAKNELFETLTFGVSYICLERKWITKKQFDEVSRIYQEINPRDEKGKIVPKYKIGEILVMQGWITKEQHQLIENDMRDTKYLYEEVKNFVKRLKYRYGSIDYINVVEPQGRGAWHCHILMRFNDHKEIYIPNNDVFQPLWGNGFTVLHDLKDVDNIGAYVSAYLCDLEACDNNSEFILKAMVNNEVNMIELDDGTTHDLNKGNHVDLRLVEKDVVENGEKVKKKYVKGTRLHMYPSGIQIFRPSRGIKKPETEMMKYFEAKKIVGSVKANYSRTIDMDRDGHPINSITKEEYNKKRKKKQGGK